MGKIQGRFKILCLCIIIIIIIIIIRDMCVVVKSLEIPILH